MSLLRHLPTVGVVAGVCLLIVGASQYPGGTMWDENTVGHRWAENFLSQLFAAKALNGEDNAARYFAIPGMLILCANIGVMFWLLSRPIPYRVHKKIIEIGGIGSVVYSFLIVTPMHDLMVNISLAFTLVAQLATLHLLTLERRWLLFAWGSLGVAILLANAAMYYGEFWWKLLPIGQKVTFAVNISWVVAVYYARIGVEKVKDVQANQVNAVSG